MDNTIPEVFTVIRDGKIVGRFCYSSNPDLENVIFVRFGGK
jgi:hypothetical protein